MKTEKYSFEVQNSPRTVYRTNCQFNDHQINISTSDQENGIFIDLHISKIINVSWLVNYCIELHINKYGAEIHGICEQDPESWFTIKNATLEMYVNFGEKEIKENII